MSPSPTGPGSWTPASTLAGRESELGAHVSGTRRCRRSFAERFDGGLALSAAGGKPERSERVASFVETAEKMA